MAQEKKVISLAGPTASGKSKLALELSKELNGEIINADSMQVYKELFILTSRPSKSDVKKIKHHLYGFSSIKNTFSSGVWLEMASQKIKKLLNTGRTPIVVGGTGLYFKSLTDGLVKIPEIPIILRNEIREMHEEIGQKNFFNKLISLDPLAENFVKDTDSQRTIRAYEVKKFTNKSISLWIKETNKIFDDSIFRKIFIDPPKSLLHKKINSRVEKMFKIGAIKEVQNFVRININKRLMANRILGVKEIKDYLERKKSLYQTKEIIKLRTRQYVKRQFTWARGHMKSWNMIYSSNFNDLCKKAINKIS